MTTASYLSPPALLLAGLLVLAAPGSSAGGGIPVHDSTNLAQIAATVAALVDIYTRQDLELDAANRTVTALTGRLGLGSIHQTPELLHMRHTLPALLSDLNRLADLPSNPDLARTLTLYGRLTDRFGLLAETVYRPRNPDAPYARAWRTDRDAQLAAATGAEVVYGHLDAREDLYSNMMNELDTREDLKASVDILARLTAENGRLLMDLTRLMSISTQASATTRLARQTQAANVRRTAAYENKTLEELP